MVYVFHYISPKDDSHSHSLMLSVFFNVLMWGVVVSCTAAANDFSKLLATRFFLGIFEATVGKH